MTIALIINAATGRMGKELVASAVSDADVKVSGALARPNHPLQGTDIGYLIGANPQGTHITDDLSAALDSDLAGQQLLIDFSLPDYSLACLRMALKSKTPMVIGTTGFSSEQQLEIEAAAQQIPIMQASNYSLGVNTLIQLAVEATRILGKQADIEIFEAHHKHKIDAPSGTALSIGEAIASSQGKKLDEIKTLQRAGERTEGEIGFSVMRAGEIVGTHEVTFALDGELMSIKHQAQSRQCFAQGAIQAAKWLFQQDLQGEKGLFSLQDMLADLKK
ncbi:4-hydroxy-tetrahydrodipicolinate reductase [Kangiella sp. TOML190]|uniref:4-hydroxy-tetrahydrodipicolinate reductase n=1 Tax=Kangiella sp. TOML190 TaxID=2931351 RepID=UPI00203A4005|nr:4-hydroxy-tetrahydrodipicolinate reductase [Kangiella sp. TOML190]